MPQIRAFIRYLSVCLKGRLDGICWYKQQCEMSKKIISQMTEAINTLMGNIEGMYADFSVMETRYNDILSENKELRERENSDSLTQLFNREGVNNAFHRVVENMRRTVKRISADAHMPEIAVLFMDIDKFKEINDANGHDVGDQVLIIIGDMLKSSFRPGDIQGRIGGDEFLVILWLRNFAARWNTTNSCRCSVSRQLSVSVLPKHIWTDILRTWRCLMRKQEPMLQCTWPKESAGTWYAALIPSSVS